MNSCPICKKDVIWDVTLECDHKFCYQCMEDWLSNNNICPTCNLPTCLGNFIGINVPSNQTSKETIDCKPDYSHIDLLCDFDNLEDKSKDKWFFFPVSYNILSIMNGASCLQYSN